MGQSSAKSKTNQSSGRDQLLREFNEQREKLLNALNEVVLSATQPNGPFPAEIIDIILRHIEGSFEQFRVACCCKLWFGFILSSNVYNSILLRRFVRSNIENGLYWPNVLMNQWSENNGAFLVGCDWSLNKDSLILNKWLMWHKHEQREVMSFITQCGYNIWTKKLHPETDSEFYFTLYINSIEIQVTKSITIGAAIKGSWELLTCFKEDGSSFEIEFNRQLGHKNRVIQGIPNLDGSSQILLWDRSLELDQHVSYKVETYDLETGKLMDSLIFNCAFILGFWKNYVISYHYTNLKSAEVSFRDLKTGKYAKDWNFQIEAPTPFHETLFIKNNKMAICEKSFVHIYDLDNISNHKIIDIAANVKKIKRKKDTEVVSVAFDNWKLVTVMQWATRSPWISIFDMTNDYRHLCTIRAPLACRYHTPIEILLPKNEKIYINAKHSELLEIDFLHPNLFKNTIKLMKCNINENKATIESVSIPHLTYYLMQGLNIDYGQITNTTYYMRDPDKPIRREFKLIVEHTIPPAAITSYTDDIFEVGRSDQKRITFIYPVNLLAHSSYDIPLPTYEITWMKDKEEFDRHWEIRQDYFSTLHLTSLDLLQNIPLQLSTRYTPEYTTGDVLFILFEEFEPQTNQWLICDPFVPAGTNLEL